MYQPGNLITYALLCLRYIHLLA